MKIFLPIYSPPWQSLSINIDWRDCAWSPEIKSVRSRKLLSATSFSLHRARRHQPINPMKNSFSESRRLRAFTLVELLTVIAIIAILAAMLLPVLSRVRVAAQKTKAKMEAQGIATAIEGYDSAYGRFPVSQAIQTLAGTNDFTYGGAVFSNSAASLPPTYYKYWTNNSEVIATLMDFTNYPNGSGATLNMSHVKNPQQTKFLNATMTSDPTLPGVGPDLVYRDPWGNPYIITMDLNYDENCNDAFYELQAVSQNPPLPAPATQNGLNGLNNQNFSVTPDNFQFHGKVMVWSAGPDGKIDSTSASAAANNGVNKDNVLSWQ
jgi:prepilin-type N-terminal cleavage/methylation domain-containing protein